MLEVKNVRAAYGRIEAIKDISLTVKQGEIVVIVGRNGAGKTTTLKTISGILKPRQGQILYEGQDITGAAPHQIARLGLNMVPEGRQIFADQTVWDNLNLGLNSRRLSNAEAQQRATYVFQLFPRLKERMRQQAGTLSGGEQQMLALGRALMQGPKLLMLDEPSLGLAPIIVTEIMQAIRELRAKETITILLVEQMRYALQIADRAYVIKTGNIVWEGSGAAALQSPEVEEAYLGKRKEVAQAAAEADKDES
jgi:branched-chain amino acid transport system ATP-binding protein